MKKLTAVIFALIMFCSLTACSLFGGTLNEETTAEKLIEYFDKKDLQNAEKLFSKYVRQKTDVKAQLTQAFEFYNSESIETKYEAGSGEGGKDDNDGYSYECESGIITVKTDDGTFEFVLTMFTYHSDEDKTGITELTVSKGESYVDVGVYAGEIWESADGRISFKMEYEDSFASAVKDKWRIIQDGTYTDGKETDLYIKIKKDEMSVFAGRDDYDDDKIILRGKIENVKRSSFEIAVNQNPKSKFSPYKKGDKVLFALKS